MKKTNLQVILTILASTFLINPSHQCGFQIVKDLHGAINRRPTPSSQARSPNSLASNDPPTRNTHKIRITLDYSSTHFPNISVLDSFVASNPEFTAKSDLSKLLLQSTADFVQERLSVYYFDTVSHAELVCSGTTLPAVTDASSDLVIVVQPQNDANLDYFAAALPCRFDQNTRPTSGIYFLNFAAMEDPDDTKRYMYFPTFVHEFTHILGFDVDAMASFPTAFEFTDDTVRTDFSKCKAIFLIFSDPNWRIDFPGCGCS
jgi:hypothetical protein